MSMYSMIFGESEVADSLLGLLGLAKSDFYRYRDCYLADGPNGRKRIAVYTRGGGGNRECFCENGDAEHSDDCVVPKQESNRSHPLYDSDEDDEFDCTYATFYFRVPDESEVATIATEPTRNEQWLRFLNALRTA